MLMMRDVLIAERVDRLEDLVAEVWDAFAETDRRFAETDRRLERHFERMERAIEQTSREVDLTSQEVRRLSREVDLTSQEVRRLSHEVDRTSQEVRASTRKWGEMSNKMGRLAEDFVSPSIPRVLRTVVNCPEEQVDMVAVRLRRRHPVDRGRSQEFDVVAVCGEYVLINETRSSLKPGDVDDFVELMSQARGFFPEYAERHFIGAIASLYVDESVVRYGQKQGLLVLGLGDDLMDVLNEPGFDPKKF
jgi:hypothetical protein